MKMKFTTPVIITAPARKFSLSDRIMLLGSCFADNMAAKMSGAGFQVCSNPFGTLYNPESVGKAIKRLDSGTPFNAEDCVPMGAGAGLICSYEHHTSFARASEEEFLANANERLDDACKFWKRADRVIITLGTSFVWYSGGNAVANCLKRPAAEFTRSMLSPARTGLILQDIIDSHPGKDFTLTVSPIRHLGDGAHQNTLSKAALLLGADSCKGCYYFPAFEILNDELRDYRFYSEDLVHPSASAVQYIWERFLETCTEASGLELIRANEKAARRNAHRPMLTR